MSQDHFAVWQRCLQIVQEEIDPQSFRTWFVPIKPLKLDGRVLTIQVPNKFFYEWLEEHYVQILRKIVSMALGSDGRLEYWIPKGQPANIYKTYTPLPNSNVPITVSKDLEKHYGQIPVRAERTEGQIRNPFVIPGIQKVRIDSQLNADYTFKNYIEGDCNRLARSAGVAIARKPGSSAFNPLTIYSDVGLGKTHLAHAIGNEVKQLFPNKQVLYVPAEQFTNQFIDAMKSNTSNDFVNFYTQIDVLIVDDIQFLANKIKTQDIFFFIFNTLHQSGRQLILTCDRPPKDLVGIEDRLLSRFKWGLSADLQVPSLETRLAIIQLKMEQDGIDMPHQVAEYISYNVRSNIRELEGILIAMIAQAALNQRDIDIALASEVMSKFVEDVAQEINVEFIQRVVADYYKIPIEQLKEKTRTKLIVIARQLSMYLSKNICGKSLAEIGRAFGGRDHTTVLHACRSVEEMLQTDPIFRTAAEGIKEKINSMLKNQ
jgi:chromosomal replication initiator protein